MKKIVYFIENLYNSGGIERVMTNKANWLVRHGYDVTVVCVGQLGRDLFYELDPMVKVVDMGVEMFDAYRQRNVFIREIQLWFKKCKLRRRLSRWLEDNPVDVLSSLHGADYAWLGRLGDGSMKVSELHFSKYMLETKANRLKAMLMPGRLYKAIAGFDKFVVLTREDMEDWGDLPNMKVIPNATSFAPEEGAALDNKQVIAVGRLVSPKRFDLLVSAWELVYDRYPDWKLAIYGDGPDREKLQAQIDASGLHDAVTLHHATKDIVEKYRESSIYALSSDFEGFGMVIVEAMSFGVPAVSFACKCGPRDIIEDGVNGILAAPGDIEGLAAGINRLIEDEALRKDMGRNAVRRVMDNFTEEVIMKKWEKLFSRE